MFHIDLAVVLFWLLLCDYSNHSICIRTNTLVFTNHTVPFFSTMARLSIGSQYFQVKGNKGGSETEELPTPRKTEPSNILDSYMVQNKLLAMKNSAMALRITEMELKIGDLIKENATLHQKSKDGHSKSDHTLDLRLRHIEATVLSKVTEILSTLLTIREEEGLPKNPLVSAVTAAIPSVCNTVTTSTPNGDKQGSFLGENTVYWAGNLSKSGSPTEGEGCVSERSSLPSIVDVAMLEDQSRSESPVMNAGTLLPDTDEAFSVHQDKIDTNSLSTVFEGEQSPDESSKKRKLDISADQPLDRSSRRKHVNYQTAKLNTKLRRQSPVLIDAVSENMYDNNLKHAQTDSCNKNGNDSVSGNVTKATDPKTKKTRKPLANITNRRRTTLLRKAKTFTMYKEEIPDKEIFEFVEPEELQHQTRENSNKMRRRV